MSAVSEPVCPICRGNGIHYDQLLRCSNFETQWLFECPKCAHIWILNPSENLNEFSEKMQSRHSSTLQANLVLKQLPEYVAHSSSLRVMDVGCWDGTLLADLPSSWVCHGVELNMTAANIAERRGIKVYAQPFEMALLERESYDLVLMMDVLEHIHDPLSALKKASSILVDGGLLIALTGNCTSSSARFFKGSWYYFNYPEHITFFSQNSIKIALQQAGMNLEKIEKISHHSGTFFLFLKKIMKYFFGKSDNVAASLPIPVSSIDKLKLGTSRMLHGKDHLFIVAKK